MDSKNIIDQINEGSPDNCDCMYCTQRAASFLVIMNLIEMYDLGEDILDVLLGPCDEAE